MQLDLFPPKTNWKPPILSELPSWANAQRVGIDVETKDIDLKKLGPGCRRPGNHVVGFSFAIEGGRKYYVPVRHEGGGNVESEDAAWRYLRAQSNDFTGEVVGMNLGYDLDWLANYGVTFPRAKFFRDVMVADALVYELHQEYGLDAIAKRWGFEGKNEALLREAAAVYRLKNVKGEMYKLPASMCGVYGEDDAELPLLILRKQQEQIDAQDLQRVFDLESRVLPVLVRMRRRGVRINEDKLSKIEAWSLVEEAKALGEIRRLTGFRIEVGDVWKAGVVAPAMAEAGLLIGRTAKTDAPKVDRALLAAAEGNAAAAALLRARKVNKLRTTFAESVRRFSINGRLHPTFNQLAGEDDSGIQRGARFGRMSCSLPNVQQQPSRDEFAARWRSIYEPEEGMQWGCCDISQQEPRWAAHFSHVVRIKGKPLQGAAEMVRRYCDDPSTDSHTMIAEISGLPRKYAKALGLGLMYGEGGAKMCRDMGLATIMRVMLKGRKYDPDSREGRAAIAGGARVREYAGEEGQDILDKFNDRVPFLKGLADACKKVALSRGYIITAGGRRCRFPVDDNGNVEWGHKALNRLIQGSGADQMKLAMVEIDAAGHYLQMQVHDEVDCSITNRAEAQQIAEIIAGAMTATVPFKIDVEVGPNWGEIA